MGVRTETLVNVLHGKCSCGLLTRPRAIVQFTSPSAIRRINVRAGSINLLYVRVFELM
jgi:hypothetical protein